MCLIETIVPESRWFEGQVKLKEGRARSSQLYRPVRETEGGNSGIRALAPSNCDNGVNYIKYRLFPSCRAGEQVQRVIRARTHTHTLLGRRGPAGHVTAWCPRPYYSLRIVPTSFRLAHFLLPSAAQWCRSLSLSWFRLFVFDSLCIAWPAAIFVQVDRVRRSEEGGLLEVLSRG